MEQKTYLVAYEVPNGRIHYATTHGRTNVEALVRLFEYSPQTRLNFISITEVNDNLLTALEHEYKYNR